MLFTEIYQSQLLKKSDTFEEKATLETPKSYKSAESIVIKGGRHFHNYVMYLGTIR